MKAERLDVQLTFRATKSEQQQIERIAEHEDRSVAQVIRRVFRQGLGKVNSASSRKARQLVGSK